MKEECEERRGVGGGGGIRGGFVHITNYGIVCPQPQLYAIDIIIILGLGIRGKFETSCIRSWC